MKKNSATRREMLLAGGLASTSFLLPQRVMGSLQKIGQPIKLGMIADLHQDVMHDGPQRLKAFLYAMQTEKPDALVQLGDFAYPNRKNEIVSKAFEKAHPKTLHVLGNHEIDDGHSFDEVARLWGMKGRYYTENVRGLNLVVLDANEKPENHKGGYPAHIGEQQLAWLAKQLDSLDGPILVISHQPLAGPSAVDNAVDVQKLLNSAADRVLLAVNGHTHIDHLAHAGKLSCLHINSASYKWVGGSYRNKSYPAEIHQQHRWVEYTCPYRECLFTTLTIDPGKGQIDVRGKTTGWVGKSPAELGIPDQKDVVNGKQVCPQIRSRRIGVPSSPKAD
ncbi:MAG: metallophosphoesterase [Planctomycetota bacterium]|nr:metallophosphoesterase [Planctomycetota bacterium]